MRYAILVAAVFAARFLATAIAYPQSDGDIEWQKWLGARILASGTIPRTLGPETFSAPGAAWLPQEWLFSIAADLAHGPYWAVFAGFVAICPLIALLLVGLRARRMGSSNAATAIMVAFAGLAFLESFGVRVQVVAWPLLAAFLYFAEMDSKRAYWAIAVTIVWANVHASVMLAPALGLGMAVGTYLDHKNGDRFRRMLAISLGAALATCANPFGWDLPIYAVHLVSSPFKDLISEWRHTTIAEEAFEYATYPMLLVMAAFGISGANAWRDRTVMVATSFLMFGAARNIAIFAIAVAPYATVSLTNAIVWLRRNDIPKNEENPIIGRSIPFVATILFLVVSYGLQSSPSRTEENQPRKAIASILAMPGHHKVFCADFSWCAFLVSSGRDSVYLDSRADPYPDTVWKKYAKIVRLKDGWSKDLKETGADIVMSGKNSAFESGLELTPSWKPVYDDAGYRVWVRQR